MRTHAAFAIAAFIAQFQSATAVPAAAEYNNYLVRKNAQAAAYPTATPIPGALKGFSVAYDPYLGTSDRDFDADFGFLKKQGVGHIRVYGTGCSLTNVVNAASKHNVTVMIGTNEIDNGVLEANLNKLISDVQASPAGWGPVDTVYIGNERLHNGASAADVVNAVSIAKGILSTKGFTGKVITVEAFYKVIEQPSVCSNSDYCGVNIHPYFNPSFTSDVAGQFVVDSLKNTQAVLPDKTFVVTEAGWPHAGRSNGAAGATPQDQQKAIASIMSKFADTPADLFLFQAFDTPYKASQADADSPEPYFGIFNADFTSQTLAVV